MYIRFQNSCTYHINQNDFEVKSDIFKKTYRFKGISSSTSCHFLQLLHDGIQENLLSKTISFENNADIDKLLRITDFLKKNGFLITTKDNTYYPPDDTLYDRQIRFFDSFENNERSGHSFNDKLQKSKIVIVGLGAYGSWLALHCARLGIKHIVGIDHDKVELSNLPRQVLYTSSDVGLYKSEACANILRHSDISIHYESVRKEIKNEQDLLPYLENADLIFNAFGYYPEEYAKYSISGIITRASILTKTPMLCLSTNWIGPFYVPDRSACYFCTVMEPEIDAILKKVKKNKRIEKRSFSPIIAMTCSLAAFEAVRLLSGINLPSTIGGLRFIDPFQIEKSSFLPIEKNDNCPYCGHETKGG